MHSFIKGMGKFDLRASSEKGKKAFPCTAPPCILYGNAWHGVSRAFARTGSNMWQAVKVVDNKISPSPGKICVIAGGAKTGDFLKGVSFRITPNRTIRVVARDAKTAASLKGVSFKLMPNGMICAVIKKKGINHG